MARRLCFGISPLDWARSAAIHSLSFTSMLEPVSASA
jgi:hypothetical protein